jgi:phosphatidylglycerophosphatase A
MNRLSRFSIRLIASGFFSGHIPFAPGTMGTIAAIPLYLLLVGNLQRWWYAGAVLALTLVAIWISGLAEKIYGRKDPPQVVIDEIAGFMLTMTAVPPRALYIILGFILFRVFDILKPQPAAWINDRVRGGSGIVLDDIVAGLYANIILQFLYRVL